MIVESLAHGSLDDAFAIWSARPHARSGQARHRDRFVHELRALVPPFGAWAVRVDGRVAGFATLTPMRFNLALRGTMAEYGTYVAERHARRGIATALASHAAVHARATAIEWILAFVGEENAPSLALFDKLGWISVGHIPRTRARQAIAIRGLEVVA